MASGTCLDLSPARPALRYFGGKWVLAPWIIGHFPQHRCYVEPFAGAASVLLRKPRSYAEIISDRDGEIVNVFRVMQSPALAAELERLLRLTPFARAEYDLAHCVSMSLPDVERARRTIIRSFMGFGADSVCNPSARTKSGFRSDSNRSGSTPARDWLNYPDALAGFTRRLQGVVLETRDAMDLLTRYVERTDYLWYVDPPYVHSSRQRVNAHGYAFELTDEQHRTLAAALHRVRGRVALSGYHSPLYDELYADWRLAERATFADGAEARVEVLWMNYPAEQSELFHSK
jgi:DNA adenine methylase